MLSLRSATGALLALCATTLPFAQTPDAPRPHILLILADDLGVGDLPSYNRESLVPTPALDRLARGGVRFTDAYCPTSLCSPTRFALMTGTYPHRSWKKNHGVLGNWDRPLIPEKTPTLPGLFQSAGYHTVGIGKWHLGATYPTLDGKPPAGQSRFGGPGTGANLDLSRPISDGPLARGFDRWQGFISASELLLFDDNRAVAALRHDTYPGLSTPGFEKLPQIPLEHYLPRITDDALAQLKAAAAQPPAQQRPLFLYFGPYVPHIPLAVPPEFRGRTRAGDYGDYVAALDHHVGRLLEALDTLGLAKNTLVIFASDNGSHFINTGDNHRPNAPYRGKKTEVWEGGVRSPLILRWPAHLPAGVERRAIVGLNDLYATLAELLRLPAPAGAAPDSISFAPALAADASVDLSPRQHLAVQGRLAGRDVRALRSGPWKYLPPGPSQPAALYHLTDDPGEKNDVAATHPDLVASLQSALDQELAPTKAKP